MSDAATAYAGAGAHPTISVLVSAGAGFTPGAPGYTGRKPYATPMEQNRADLATSLCRSAVCSRGGTETTHLRFEVTIPAGADQKPRNGHLMLLLSRDSSAEPRQQFTPYVISSQFTDPFRICTSAESQQAFGVDVNDLPPGRSVIVDEEAIGFPAERLSDLPSGDFYVQAVFNVYEEFHLASGKTVKLAPDKGEGQHWQSKPGNPYSTPAKMHVDPKLSQILRIALDKVIPPIQPEPDTKYIKHIRIRSAKLSRFWGRDVYVRRKRSSAGRLGGAPERTLSAHRLSKPLSRIPARQRRFSLDASRFERERTCASAGGSGL